jgi:4-amino-4-deoxy-L-arabinose transferase-like glycosyltransferase
LRRGASGFLDWFGILTFGLASLTLWAIWIALLTGFPTALAERAEEYQPGFVAHFYWFPFALSLFFTLLWFGMIRPARRSARRAVLNWATGITLCWGLAFTILLPYIDWGKSYRGMIAELNPWLSHPSGCVASRGLGEPQRALLEYFAKTITVREELRRQHDCRLLLVQGGRDETEETPERGWRKVWEGNRPGDRHERFWLYEKTKRNRSKE